MSCVFCVKFKDCRLLFSCYSSSLTRAQGKFLNMFLSCSMSTLLFTRPTMYISLILFKEINFYLHVWAEWSAFLKVHMRNWCSEGEFTSKIPHSWLGVTKCGPEIKTEKHSPWDKASFTKIGIKSSTSAYFTLEERYPDLLPLEHLLRQEEKAQGFHAPWLS